MLPRLAIALVGSVLSWTMYRILESLPPRPVASRIVRTVAVSVPMAVLFAASDAVLGGVVLADLTIRCPGSENCTWSDVWSLEVGNTISWLFVFSAWGLLHLALRATIEARAADTRANAEREAARVAEIRALRYQVNPHFLFNCLNSLGTLVARSDTIAARGMIGQMSSFLRYGLAIDPLADVDLDDEVEMQSRYLEIERLRFAHRLSDLEERLD
jgi:two-component system, LytTR family, sensor kinase